VDGIKQLADYGIEAAHALIRMLKTAGYNSLLSFEWEKRWHPDIPDPELALPSFRRWITAAPETS
jgi:hypothetical protein